DDVAGPDGREHAAAGDPDARVPGGAERVGHQVRRDGQEVLRTERHWPMTGLVFPHASAIVSNSCSRLNAGFWYGFFPRGFGSGVPSTGSAGVSFGGFLPMLLPVALRPPPPPQPPAPA